MKPSTRINELAQSFADTEMNIFGRHRDGRQPNQEDKMNAIVVYLDEEYEKQS